MPDQDSSVVVIDSDQNTAEQTASRIRFLGFDACIATNPSALPALIAEQSKIVAVLVTADRDYQALAAALKLSADAGLRCAFFLMERKSVSVPPPAALGNRLQASLSTRVGYQELLAALHDAEMYTRIGIDPRSGSGQLFRNLVGVSREMQELRDLIKQVAGTEATVLITGESGTGKEAVASNIHGLSPRRDHPFVPVNCGAIPSELLESELFGHEKGAFTGAISSRQGRFEIAEGGTLFLDEIGDMPMEMQIKLLRVLQERTYERVGSNKTIQADVRIVAATHQNLEQLVAEGKFRMDLFYRLNVFPIQVAPLRERAGDIPLLVESYIKKREFERLGSLRLSDCALASLARYFWPGNVRELFNLLERLSILFPRQVVRWSDLPEKFRPNQELFVDAPAEPAQPMGQDFAPGGHAVLPVGGIDLRPHLANIETSLLTQALAQSDWVVARAAKLLNLQRTTLVEKIRKMDLRRPKELTDF